MTTSETNKIIVEKEWAIVVRSEDVVDMGARGKIVVGSCISDIGVHDFHCQTNAIIAVLISPKLRYFFRLFR